MMKCIKESLILTILVILINGCGAEDSLHNNLCQSPITLQNSTLNNGIKLDIKITQCNNENQPIKIKSIVTNENNFSVIYRMSNIGDPAIYTFVSNPHFSLTSPTNPNDPQVVLPAIDYGTLMAEENITRETTWDNKLSIGSLAPNGDYNISVHFIHVQQTYDYDDNATQIVTAIIIKKEHSENFITPKNAIDDVLKDTETKTWLDAHEGILCRNNEKYSFLKYENGEWRSTRKNDSYSDQSITGIECSITLKSDKAYHFYAVDKFYSPTEIRKDVSALK